MNKVLILTKTNWNEPPRIRHQITRLLKNKGYSVFYIERNSYKNLFIKNRNEEGIKFFSHAELIHHQLRYFPLIQKANNLVVQFFLKRILKNIEFDFIVNFCYDYTFLKALAPDKKIITMIEDDFESQAKFGMSKQIRNQVSKTCQNSDYVLTVSYPLFNKLIKYNENVRMLFPWSQSKYRVPNKVHERNVVLYFGFVHRLDWAVIEELVRGTNYNFRFVGPTAKSNDVRMINYLKTKYLNFEYISYSTIKNLKLDDVFCSILPYDPIIKSVQACTISNRAFNLLSLGLPLVYANLQYLINAPETVIRKNKSIGEYIASLNFFHTRFYEVQTDIQNFLSSHYEDDRWSILSAVIND